MNPSAASIMAYARNAAAMRHGFTARHVLTTVPSFDTKTTSIGKRMKTVCTLPHGAMIIA